MFVDKQKLERVCLDEITKVGNLFDTLKIKYCVFGEYALLANGIKTKNFPYGVIFSDSSSTEKILEMLFKMNYTVYFFKPELIKAKKTSSSGDVKIDILLGKIENKSFLINYKNKQMVFPKKIFDADTKEVWGYFGRGKSGKGFFRVASLEAIYLSKMNSDDDFDINDLEIIKGSGKLDIDKLFKLFKRNGLI